MAKKLESTFVNMVGVLCAVTIVSAASLGAVYNFTKENIEKSKEQKKLNAIKEVVKEGYNNLPNKEMFSLKTQEGDSLECYPAKEGEKITSVAIKTYSKQAFSGEIWLMVGFLEDGTINNVSVVQQMETPGLGTKIADMSFKKQFLGKNPAHFNVKVKQDGGDVDAITAATISSRAYCDAIERAYKAYMNKETEI